MEQLNQTLQRVIDQALLKQDSRAQLPDCRRCFDTGMVIISSAWSEAKVCRCQRRALARRALNRIPTIFGRPKLSRLKPRTDIHPGQERIIAALKANPDASYLLSGRNGVGKSYLGWAMYRYALAKGRGVISCTVRDLLADFRKVEVLSGSESVPAPRITAEQLRRPGGARWLLILEEFEKARPSEFASEMLFNVLDAARSFNHQLFVTSNLRWEELRQHWGRTDEMWGNSIIERLKGCYTGEMY